MTYWHFHVVFILPPLLLLVFVPPRPWTQRMHRNQGLFLGLIGLIAFAYTTPWDNYLVYRGVWSYSEGRVLGTIGYVPVEEYLFFLLQPLLTGLWFYRLLPPASLSTPIPTSRRPNTIGTATSLLLAVVGFFLLQHESGLYMGLILTWAMPVLAGQWAYAGRSIWALRRYGLLGVLVPTVYLWIADRIAIGLGVWQISEPYTLGWHLAGLPVEEATFFLVTNLLVVQGLILFLRGAGTR